ncbi:MAG TPA: DinB family protein [Puia sp.]|nr:DinB family protein [Puia sp.]
MSLFDKQSLLSELIDRTEIITSNTKSFLRLSEDQLNYKPAPQTWSISEIYSHLNITNSAYNSFILKKIKSAEDVSINHCQSGWLGDWVYEKLMPRADGSVFKINSPKSHRANITDPDAFEVLNTFLEQQDVMHDILQHASTKDLDRITVPFYYSKILKFRLCDTLRFIIAHNERHLMQAHRMIEKMPVVQKG